MKNQTAHSKKMEISEQLMNKFKKDSEAKLMIKK